MKTAATQVEVDSKSAEILYMAFELGRKKWKLGFSTGLGQKALLKQPACPQRLPPVNKVHFRGQSR